MRRIVVALMISMIAGLAGYTATYAHRPSEPQENKKKGNGLKEMIEESNLVALGEVANVEYVKGRTKDGHEIPHTIVTYSLGTSVRGKPTEKTLSLQFIGGTDGKGRFMAVSGVPQFQEGEKDLLFVRGNGADGKCPLVNCEYGRYRIHQNRVYNTHGQPVRGLVNNEAIARGPRAKPFRTFKYPAPDFVDLMKNPEADSIVRNRDMSLEEARREYKRKAPKEIVVTRKPAPRSSVRDKAAPDPQSKGRRVDRPEPPLGKKPVTLDKFVKKIQELNRKTERKPTSVESVKPDTPIVLESIRPAGARAPEKTHEPGQRDARNKEEVRRMKEQNFNPVIKEGNND